MGQTFSEKALGRKAGRTVRAGEVITVSPDYYLSHDNSSAIIGEFKKLGLAKVVAPDKIVIVLDHIVPAADEKYAQNHKTIREFVAEQGIPNFFDIHAGVCHQVFSEASFALPGAVIMGSDSHTTTYGAFGAFAAGIGRTETASLWATDEIWLRVPETLRIEFRGAVPRRAFTPRTRSSRSSATTAPTGRTTRPSSSPGRRRASSASPRGWSCATWPPRWAPRTATSSRTSKTLDWLKERARGRLRDL